MALCWSENAQLSGDSRKALKDSTVMSGEASLTFVFVVEYLVKRVKRSLELKEDLGGGKRQKRQNKHNPRKRKRKRDHTCCFSRMNFSKTPKSNKPPFVALSLL